MLPLPFLPYEGGPTIIEWLNQICQKFNELLTAVKNVRELPPGGTHGQVATPKEDGSGYEWVNHGGGSDDLWYPTVTTAGIISWAKSSTTTPPASRNIKGPQGNDGTPGKDGMSPTANVAQTETGATITITDASGTTTAKLTNGAPGADGAPGKDGITPTFEVGTVTKLSPDAEPTVTLEDVGGGLYMIDYGIPQGQPGTPGTGSGGVEWVEVTPTQGGSSNLNTDYLKLWYDKNDHQHLKFEGYIWATAAYSQALSLTMPDDFSPVASEMWAPLPSIFGVNTSNIPSSTILYVQCQKYPSLTELRILPSGFNTSWLAYRRYAVGSEIYLNPSQMVPDDEDKDNSTIHPSDGSETQYDDEH